MKIAILGAGLTGLELGRRLNQLGYKFTIFEKEDSIGGLARTTRSGPYAWDYGVHAMYSKDPEISRYYNSLPMGFLRHRNVKILHKGRLISYPFENGVRELPIVDRLECILGYLLAKKKIPSNLREWIDTQLGYGISKHFMTPYNMKIWNCLLSDISFGLVTSKIEPMKRLEFLLSALGKKTTGRAYQARFLYPFNGIQDFVDYTARDIKGRIRLNAKIEKPKFENGKWEIAGEKFDRIVSTIPLPDLLSRLNLQGVFKWYSELKWNNTYFIVVGLWKGRDFGKFHGLHWAFFKENEMFYRLTFMHNFSQKFEPLVVAEVTDRGVGYVKELVLYDLFKKGVIQNKSDVAFVAQQRLQYTYPIPLIETGKRIAQLEKKLGEYNLHLLGRSGRWQYLNMDGVLKEVDRYVTTAFDNSSGDSNNEVAELLGARQQGVQGNLGDSLCGTGGTSAGVSR